MAVAMAVADITAVVADIMAVAAGITAARPTIPLRSIMPPQLGTQPQLAAPLRPARASP